MTDGQLENWFTHHPPTPEQQISYGQIRSYARLFATIINEHVPECADKTAAMRKLRECVMTANAAIACGGQ